MKNIHAIERLQERYDLTEDDYDSIRSIMNDTRRCKIISIDEKSEIREIRYQGKEIHILLKYNQIVTILPPTKIQGFAEKRLTEARIRNEDLRLTNKILRQGIKALIEEKNIIKKIKIYFSLKKSYFDGEKI